MIAFKASDLFDLKINGNFPLNCEFVPKTPIPLLLETAGIYMLFFDQQIIYIGLADNQPVLERIQMQLSTITLRGKDVSFNEECITILKSVKLLSNDFSQAISQNNMRFETSKKRIAFAAQNWDVFSTFNQDDLSRFVIVWFHKNECIKDTLIKTKNHLINEIKPSCNFLMKV